jgi:hypothetical protein
MISSDKSINERIIKMRKEKAGLPRIQRWLVQWDNFAQLDEQIVLAHILNVLDEAQLAVSKTEVRNCLNRFYNQSYHGDKNSYLAYLYTTFNVKSGAVTNPKRSHRITSELNTSIVSNDNQFNVKLPTGVKNE